MSEGKDDQKSQDRSGSSRYPSILSSFTPEESLSGGDPGDESKYNSSTSERSLFLLDSSGESLGAHEQPLMSVLTQTDSSWLLSHSLGKPAQDEHTDAEEERDRQASSSSEASEKESDSILEDDLSDSTSKESLEDLLVHTEFIDQLKPGRFGSCLYTLPSVGLPTILAYKHESREKPIDYKALSSQVTEIWLQKVRELDDAEDYWQWTKNGAMQKEYSDHGSGRQFGRNKETLESIGFTHCQFCGKILKPLSTHRQMSGKTSKMVFCCKQHQDLSEFLMEEEELLDMKFGAGVIDVSPHLPRNSLVERQKAKEKMAMRLHKRTMEKYLRKTKETENKLVSEGPKKMTTINFHLSTSVNVEMLKKPREEEDEWEKVFTEEVDDTFSWHKDLPLSFLMKNYRNGNKFLMTFADGTAQIFYPSGNLAILIFIDKEKKITCIVQEDRATDPAVRAIFTSYGRCTCYHLNGVVWVNTNAFGGHYADEHGTRLRRWYWRDPSSPLIFTPFKPIFISLNENIGVRIIEQQRIFLSFLAMGKQAKFNLGSILKFKTPTMQSITNSWTTEADLLLQTSWLKIQTIINKLCVALNFPSNDPEKIALPLYLVTQQQKLSQLYGNIKMEESIKHGKCCLKDGR